MDGPPASRINHSHLRGEQPMRRKDTTNRPPGESARVLDFIEFKKSFDSFILNPTFDLFGSSLHLVYRAAFLMTPDEAVRLLLPLGFVRLTDNESRPVDVVHLTFFVRGTKGKEDASDESQTKHQAL